MAGEEPADDVPNRAELGLAGLDQRAADVVPKPENWRPIELGERPILAVSYP